MATLTKYASSNGVVSGTAFTNPTNAYADDGTLATLASSTKNVTVGTHDFGFAGITTEEIPDGATIDAVRLVAEVGLTAAVTGGLMGVLPVENNASAGTEQTRSAAGLAVLTATYTTLPTLANLRTAGRFEARIRYTRGNTTTASTAQIDYVRLEVDWTLAVALAGAGSAVSPGGGLLSVATPLVGAGSAASTGDGQLTVAQDVALVGAGSSTATGAGVLAVALALLGSGTATSSGSAALTTSVPLIGAGSATASGAGILGLAVSLLGAGASSATGSGVLGVVTPLQGAGAGVASGTGLLTVSVVLAGAGAGVATGDGLLTVSGATGFLGSGSATSTGAAVLTVEIAIVGVGTAVTVGAGTLGVALAFLGSAAAVASGTGVLSVESGAPIRAAVSISHATPSHVQLTDAPLAALLAGQGVSDDLSLSHSPRTSMEIDDA